MDPDDDDDRLVIAMRHAARALTDKRSIRDLERTLAQIVAAAVQTVPGVDAGSISMTEGGRVQTRHPTSTEIGKLDDIQSQLGEGPCISAIFDPPENGIVIAEDFAGREAGRWPGFAPHAVEFGYRSLMSTQLSPAGSIRATLNLYARAPEAFNQEARTLAGLFGVQAALVLYGAEQAAHLQRAVDTRDVIGQAKGILMERHHADDQAAFQMLVSASQDTNIKLVDVARWLTSETNQPPAPDQRANLS